MIKISYQGLDHYYETEQSSQDLFSACKEAKFPVSFSCRVGTCGICKIEVIEGLENFSKKSKSEKEFTNFPNERLACLSRVKGSVKIVRSRN